MKRGIASRLLVASLTLGPLFGCKSDPAVPGPAPGIASAIRLVEGTVLSGVVGKELPTPLVVEVTDASGKAVPNQIVNFRIVSGGGSVFAGAGLTNAAGRAQERWTLGTHVAEAQALEARAVASDTGAALVFATISATALPDVPSSMSTVSGDGQSGLAGAALANPLVVQAADQYGNPVPGVSVAWTVEDAGGSLDASVTPTDGSGRASNRWTLGPLATTQHVRAEAGSLVVRFSTAGVGGIPALLSMVVGDQQSTSEGTPVLFPPTVRVTDALGNPMAGIVVQFAVTAGGGTVLASSANTDASGLASCGGWTLGDTPGANAVTASAQGLPSVVFSATATSAISISGGVSQGRSAFVGDSFVVHVWAAAPTGITSVIGSIGGSEVMFAMSPVEVCTPRVCSIVTTWNGTMSGVGLFGPATVTVTARDTLGHQASTSIAVEVDRPPVVTVSQPRPEWLARPSIAIAGTCADDNPTGCASLVVMVGAAGEADCISGAIGPWSDATVVAQGTSSVEQTIDLSTREGDVANLCFVGTDSAGRTVGAFRNGYVESSPRLTLIATVGGSVLDASGTRVLYLDRDASIPSLRVSDSASGTDRLVVSDGRILGAFSFLSPIGAVYSFQIDQVTGRFNAWDWRDGTTVDLGEASAGIQVREGYALWTAPPRNLVRRDLLAGTSLVVSTDVANGSSDLSLFEDVAPNGDVAFIGGTWGEVFRYRDGVTTKVSSDPVGIVADNTRPMTDGSTIAYLNVTGALTIVAGGTEVRVRPAIGFASAAILAGGWLAYSTYATVDFGAFEVWRYGPAGEQLLATVSDFRNPEAIGPDGAVVFTDRGRRYRSVPGSAPEDIGAALGTVVHRDGRFLELLGASVLEVSP